MVFLVFVGFYLVTDHAPWWVWGLLALAHVVDTYRESASAALAYRQHAELMRRLSGFCLPRSR